MHMLDAQPPVLHFPEQAEVPETKDHLELRTLLYQFLMFAFSRVAKVGSEQFVYLRSGNQEFTSRMASRAQLAAGNNVEVIFDTEKMHVFDKQTEMALA